MATRRTSVFSGMMQFGILTVPVKMYKPHFDEEENKAPASHLEHNCGKNVVIDDEPMHLPGACGSPITRPWFCPACSSDAEYKDLVKVYENGAVLTQEEAKGARISDKEFVIEEFVNADEVDPMHMAADLYFIEVDGNAAVEAYSVFAQALKSQGKVAVASWTSRGTDKVLIVRPYRDGLVGQVLNYGNLLDAPTYNTVESSPDMVAMLGSIMTKKTVSFEPSKYKSEYVANLRQLVGDAPAPVAAAPAAPKKSSLADMLAMMAA